MVDNFMHPFVAIIHAGFEGNYKVNQNAFPHWEYQEQHIQSNTSRPHLNTERRLIVR